MFTKEQVAELDNKVTKFIEQLTVDLKSVAESPAKNADELEKAMQDLVCYRMKTTMFILEVAGELTPEFKAELENPDENVVFSDQMVKVIDETVDTVGDEQVLTKASDVCHVCDAMRHFISSNYVDGNVELVTLPNMYNQAVDILSSLIDNS